MKKVKVIVENDITGEETYYWNTKIALAQADLEQADLEQEREVGENPFEGMNFQVGLFPTAGEIAHHDLVSIGEQHREEEFILSRCGAYLERNPWYTGPRTPHPEECDDNGEPYFRYGYYEVECQHNFIKALPIKQSHNPIYDDGIDDEDIPF